MSDFETYNFQKSVGLQYQRKFCEMTPSTKRKTLIVLGLVTFIVMMIAASLPKLELQAGMPLPSLQHGQVIAPKNEDEIVSISVNHFVVVLIAIMLVGAILYLTYKLLTGADRKFIVGLLSYMLVICVIFSVLSSLLLRSSNSANYNSPLDVPIPTSEPVVTSPLGPVPTPLLWLVGIGLLVISVLVGVWIFASSQAKPIDLVGSEAEKAWQALKTGSDLKDVIMRCYLQMSLALNKTQGIERKDFMTTGEFENLLKAAGIPHEPIHQLTRLFDAVRYGNWQPNTADEQEAIQCLESIMLYCRETREAS
jgi:hypothetical protein